MPNGRGEYERPLSVRCASYPMFVSLGARTMCVPGEARPCVAPCRACVAPPWFAPRLTGLARARDTDELIADAGSVWCRV